MNFLKWLELGGYSSFRFDPDPGGGGGNPNPPAPPAPPAPNPPAPPAPPPVETFTQDAVNTLMKKEKDKHRAALEQHLTRIKELETGKNLSDEQRASLAVSKGELEEQLMTAQQRAEQEKNTLSKAHAEELGKEQTRANLNWQLFEKSKMEVAISNAASKHKAYRPEQVALIVGPLCNLIPIKDDQDKIVDWKVEIKAEVKKEGGGTEVKTMSVDQYVEHIKGQDDYANLFLSERVSGAGYRPSSGSTHGADPSTMTAQDKIAAGMRQGLHRQHGR